jgi:hypothetical protein
MWLAELLRKMNVAGPNTSSSASGHQHSHNPVIFAVAIRLELALRNASVSRRF